MVVSDILVKNCSILISLSAQYGVFRKVASIAADMSIKMILIKNPSNRYFKLRNKTSNHRQREKFPPKNRLPIFQTASDKVPTGQSQEQKDFLASRLIEKKVRSRTSAAGCRVSNWPVVSSNLRLASPPIGRNPSTPVGRATKGAPPWLVKCWTNWPNRIPR